MHRLFRIEHKEDGCGPYQMFRKYGTIHTIHGKVVHQGDEYPTPYEDTIGRHTEPGELCGFVSKESMLNWFTVEELKGLIKLGYKVRIYHVQPIAIGEKQCIFKP